MSGQGQTSYPTSLPVGYPGMLADIADKMIETAINELLVPIPFGLGMVKGTGDKHYRLPTGSGDKIDGIGVHTHGVNTIGSVNWASTPGPGNVPTWVALTYYHQRDRVLYLGQMYECTTAGTSATPTGPTALTTAVDSITDGTAKWKYVQTEAAGVGFYEPGIPTLDVFNLLIKGRIYVLPETDVVQDAEVWCRFAKGGVAGRSDQLGAFRSAVDTLLAWVASTAYHVGDRRISSGNMYECITAGTSDTPTGPSAVTADITDGTVHWKYVQVQATGASNTIVKGARFVVSANAGVPVPISFDKLLGLS